tara:strand:- start:242 stop:385 length:144 start_codon:yes stop_codon:yes gene_type:complete
MKVKVTMMVAGNVFSETVIARDYQDAKEICRRRQSSKMTIISVTAVF